MTYREPQGLDRFANTDPSLHFNQFTPSRNDPTWQGAFIYCLKVGDKVSAHIIRLRNDHDYAERIADEAANAFPAVGAQMRSLSEAASEREEAEVV